MRQEIAERWVAALRSGKYKQTVRALCVVDAWERSYCCLGVLCELAVAEGAVRRHSGSALSSGAGAIRYGVAREWRRLPVEVVDWAGLRTREGVLTVCMDDPLSFTLTLMNDNGMAFEEIANAIESRREEL